MDELLDPQLTLKVIGRQWYWSYEISDANVGGKNLTENVFNFDSYMLSSEDNSLPQLRLLEVDNPLLLPINTSIRILVTSSDVLHSWAVPSLGIKIDSCPGRLNQVALNIYRKGIFYGQCSELCGINHGFMPIVVIGVDLPVFLKWINSNQ
jgi:heme/copper-type cytochrome/quinol oxidase subunit 2